MFWRKLIVTSGTKPAAQEFVGKAAGLIIKIIKSIK
ncbi:hypothetical protein QFZ80_006587 [Paenibacillus sp. V4I7]|nr:hypothetical protein [Paenibacillus sp. V4I7]